jgi:phosphoribosylanthranilate isomerase
VYVNMDSDQLVSHILDTGINESQFHGDEPPAIVAGFKGARIDTFTHLHPITTETLDEYSRQTDLSYPSDMDGFPLLVRAFRLHDNSLSFVTDYLRDCQSAGALPSAILLDAHQSGSYGGTGQTLDWASIPKERDKLLGLPLILAGGLTPDNVAEAIATARPDAVDVASGVESAPGKKDPAKVRDFLAAAKEAFAAIGD